MVRMETWVSELTGQQNTLDINLGEGYTPLCGGHTCKHLLLHGSHFAKCKLYLKKNK